MGSGRNTLTVTQPKKDLLKQIRTEEYDKLVSRLLMAADPETLNEIRRETMDMDRDELTLQAAIVHDEVSSLRHNPDILEFPNGVENLDLDVANDKTVEAARELVADVQSDKQPAVTDGGEK